MCLKYESVPCQCFSLMSGVFPTLTCDCPVPGAQRSVWFILLCLSVSEAEWTVSTRLLRDKHAVQQISIRRSHHPVHQLQDTERAPAAEVTHTSPAHTHTVKLSMLMRSSDSYTVPNSIQKTLNLTL